MDDLAKRLANRVQLTSDGHKAYLEAVEGAFGTNIDHAMLVKVYGPAPEGQRRYGLAECIGAVRHRVEGNRDPNHVSTSFSERQNLSMRMGNRRTGLHHISNRSRGCLKGNWKWPTETDAAKPPVQT